MRLTDHGGAVIGILPVRIPIRCPRLLHCTDDEYS